MPDIASIDYETFCFLDLPKVGSSRYARHPSCEVLMAAWCVGDGDVKQWRAAEGEPLPAELEDILSDPNWPKSAWNAPFEKQITRHVLKIETPDDCWTDPMVMSYRLAMPGDLDSAGLVVRLPEELRKIKGGTLLMNKFSKPRKPTKTNSSIRLTPLDDWTSWEEYLLYNRRDVIAERAIRNRLLNYTSINHEEREVYLLDQEINAKGMPINMAYVRNAIAIAAYVKARMLEQMRGLTGLANPNSNEQLLPWIRERGYPFDDLKKGHVERALERAKKELATAGDNFGPELERLIEVLQLRQQVSKTSVTKYNALERATDSDGMLRFGFQYAGAARTWRWAGRLFQVQNLAKPTKELEKSVETIVQHISDLDPESFFLIYDKPMDALSAGIRPSVQAPEGMLFADVDLSAIENIVLGWMSGEQKILNVFEQNKDPYLDFAQYLYGEKYEDLLKEFQAGGKGKRTISKPGVLGCFGADTPVLTKRGWTRIVDLLDDDEVHDGIGWTTHGGVAYRGERDMLCGHGIHATSDHKFKVGKGWMPWGLAKEPRTFKSVLATAIGASFVTTGVAEVPGSGSYAAVLADLSELSPGRTSFEASLRDAPAALLATVAPQSGSESARRCSTYSQIVSTLRERGARTPKTRLFGITGVGEFVCGSIPLSPLSPIVSTLSARMAGSKSTGKITTATTSREICVSLRDPSKMQTSGPSWDIVNAGKRQSFVVLTESGPAVVHNCGYMLSAGEVFENETTGELEATGLLGYAWNMGVREFTLDNSQHSVKTWRETYRDAVAYWGTIDKAARGCLSTGEHRTAGPVEFRLEPPFLRMYLPSGRYLSYLRPRLEPRKTPWGAIRDTITYEGQNDKKQWVRISTHPGKWTENADQAIARDLLAHGMLLADKQGLDLRIHVHDQIVTMGLKERAADDLEILKQCMTTRPKWGRDIPLRVGGFTSPFFVKD